MPTDAGGRDDDDELTPPRGIAPTEARTTRGRTDGRDPRSDVHRGEDDGDDEPNYLIRRGLVVACVVVVIAAAAVVVSRFIGGDDGSPTDTASGADWDTIVVLTDEIRLLDRDSADELATYRAPPELRDAQSLVAGGVLVTMGDDGRITQTDLADGTQRSGRAGADETLRLSPDNAVVALVGPDGGGDVSIVDTRDRSVVSVADIADLNDPLIFATDVLVNRSGSHVAVPVPSSFQSVVIDLATGTSKALAGRVIAIDDEHVVTEQPAGPESGIGFYDLDGTRLGSVDVTAPRATLLRPDGTLLLVAGDGSIQTADADGSVDDRDPLVDPDGDPVEIRSGIRVADGARLVAAGGGRVFVLDDSGAQLGVAGGGVIGTVRSSAQCLAVGAGTSTSSTTVLDAESGAVVVEIERGAVTAESVDGCTATVAASGRGASPMLLTNGELIDVAADSISAVAPDGAAYVAIDGRDSEYVRFADDGPIEIGDRSAIVHFGQR